MYAQTLTMASVRKAPATPESKALELKNHGKTETSQGITYVEAKSAMTPAKNPSKATKANILIRSFMLFHPFA
jgi:hypothetical protein